jgi:hypothetical protein
MDILNEFSRSEKQFKAWFWSNYGLPPEIFEGAPFDKQCEAIWRFLGYQVNVPDGWTIIQIEEYTRNILYIYENLMKKYPDDIPDTLHNLTEISYIERTVKYPEMDKPRDILHNLNEAIVRIDKYHIKIKPIPSLADAIIMIKKILLVKTVEDKFWGNIFKTKENEEAPF